MLLGAAQSASLVHDLVHEDALVTPYTGVLAQVEPLQAALLQEVVTITGTTVVPPEPTQEIEYVTVGVACDTVSVAPVGLATVPLQAPPLFVQLVALAAVQVKATFCGKGFESTSIVNGLADNVTTGAVGGGVFVAAAREKSI